MKWIDGLILAVLPFDDLTYQKELSIYCRSFSSDLGTELSKFRQFFVLACPPDFPVTNPGYIKFLDESNVDYHITGSFRFDKELARINIQLYDSRLQHLVWANRLETPLTDLVEVQELRKTGSTVEKARSAVTWRIRNAIARIELHLPVLGAYLSNTIKTGTLCCYQPARAASWITG